MKSAAWRPLSLSCTDASSNLNCPLFYPDYCITYASIYNVRFAMTFKEIVTDDEGKKAVNLKVIFFPETYMSSRDRPYLDEMLQQLTSSEKGIK